MNRNFYDTETTGLDWGWDNILQFSAIRTDDNLNPIKTVNLRGRPFPWVIPHPAAMITTGVGPKSIFSAPLTQYQLMRAIHVFFDETPYAINTGFNSIGYDEGMLRAGFFQSLHPMYVTQKSGNGRADIMLLAQAVFEHDPSAIKTKINAKGKPSFKLGDLIEANGLTLEHAHDAMGDTEGTLKLAAFLRGASPGIWCQMSCMVDKKSTLSILEDNDFVLHTDRKFRNPTILATLVTEKGSDAVLADLSFDPKKYIGAKPDELLKLMKGNPRVFRVVKTNAYPTIISTTPRSAGKLSIPETVAAARVDMIRTAPELVQNIKLALGARFPDDTPDKNVERRMYGGFPTPRDERLMAQFHANPESNVEPFDSQDLNEIHQRLTDNDYAEKLRKRLASEDAQPWLTIRAAKEELDECRTKYLDAKPELLTEIGEYLNNLGGEIS